MEKNDKIRQKTEKNFDTKLIKLKKIGYFGQKIG